MSQARRAMQGLSPGLWWGVAGELVLRLPHGQDPSPARTSVASGMCRQCVETVVWGSAGNGDLDVSGALLLKYSFPRLLLLAISVSRAG